MINVSDTLQLLGERAPKGKSAERAARDLVRKGLPAKVVDRLAKAFGASGDEILALIGLSRATGYRQKARGAGGLRAVHSDRAFRLARVMTLAQSVLEDDQNAREWFREPNRALHGERPMDLLDTETGTEQVVRVLNQLEHGVYT
jgi:putative toxin-antitoxin system antitoxin component (TIGR02293 family)